MSKFVFAKYRSIADVARDPREGGAGNVFGPDFFFQEAEPDFAIENFKVAVLMEVFDSAAHLIRFAISS